MMVRTNIRQCELVGEEIGRYKVRSSFQERDFLNCKVPEEIKVDALFFAVAICHQTHALHNPQTGVKGWDYIEEVFTTMMRDNDPWLDPSYMSQILLHIIIRI